MSKLVKAGESKTTDPGAARAAAFRTASDALNAALDAHLALLEQPWGETGPIRVRMALHTGVAEERDNDYFGPTLNRVARLQALGHGEQTLLSQATYELVKDRLPEQAMLQEMEKNGTRVKPEFGSVWYHLAGPDKERARTHMTIAVPGATAQSMGLPDKRVQNSIWIMNAGTTTAHLMVPGE